MNPVTRQEILGLAEYEAIRGPFRARVIAEKKRRRVAIGPKMTAVFENHDTALLQIQEMLRTERITREAAVLHEIETYNQLVPGPDELSATVMIEIAEAAERDAFLASANGIERTLRLSVGDASVAATFDPTRVLPDRASAVLYVKFPLTPAMAGAIREGRGPVTVGVAHPAYAATVTLAPEVIGSLAEDLG